MRGFACLAVLVGAMGGLAGPLSTPATARPVDEVYASLVDANTLEVCWSDEDLRGAWTLTMARGTRPPRRTAAPVAWLPARSQCHEVDGLAFGVAYTFTVVVHLERGARTTPTSVTAATRRPGQFVWARSRTRRAPRATGADGRVLLAAGAGSRPEVAALFWRNRGRGTKPFVATLSPAGAWSPARQIADDFPIFYAPLIAGNARGDLAVAWQPSTYAPDLYRLRTAGSRRWRQPVAPFGAAPADPDPVPVVPGDRIQALVLDGAGSLHLLLIHGYNEARYVTNATGRWTSSLIPPPWCPDRGGCTRLPSDLPLMAYDPLTNRLVLAARHFETRVIDGRSQRVSVLTIADKPAAALAFGPAHEARAVTTPAEIVPASLSAHGGQISVALTRWGKRRGPHIVTGDGPERMGAPVRVPGTTGRDVALPGSAEDSAGVLTAAPAARDRIFVAWQRDRLDRPSWKRARQGIWLRAYVRNPTTGDWRFRPARHITNSAYDRLDSLAISADGPVVGYRTY